MKRIVLLLICLAIMPLGAQAGKLFRWMDAQGKVHYGDMPPVGATQITPIKSPAAPEPAEDLPYETRLAQQNFPVTLYVAESCTEYCNHARDLLGKRGIPFSEKALRTKEEIDAFKALSGFDSVPALSIGKIILRGFQANQWNNELDMAGYPKTAPYRIPKTSVAPATPTPTIPATPAAASQVAPTDTVAP